MCPTRIMRLKFVFVRFVCSAPVGRPERCFGSNNSVTQLLNSTGFWVVAYIRKKTEKLSREQECVCWRWITVTAEKTAPIRQREIFVWSSRWPRRTLKRWISELCLTDTHTDDRDFENDRNLKHSGSSAPQWSIVLRRFCYTRSWRPTKWLVSFILDCQWWLCYWCQLDRYLGRCR